VYFCYRGWLVDHGWGSGRLVEAAQRRNNEIALIVKSAVDRAAKRLAAAGVEEARRDAWLLLGHLRGQNRAQLMADALASLDDEQASAFEALVARRAGREPFAQIVGRK
jgi:methylase of polypeptide subunit release factors